MYKFKGTPTGVSKKNQARKRRKRRKRRRT